MPLAISNTTVGTTAVEVVSKDSTRWGFAIANEGAAKIYVGPTEDVTTATGYPIAAGGQWSISRDNQGFHPAGGPVWAISGTPGQDVRSVSLR
jgi:hypothetical protein